MSNIEKKCGRTHWYTNNPTTDRPDEGQLCWCGKQKWDTWTNQRSKYAEQVWRDWRTKKITFKQFLLESYYLLVDIHQKKQQERNNK